MYARLLTRPLSTSSFTLKGGHGARLGGTGHPRSRPLSRIRQRQNHLMTRKTVIETKGEQDKIPTPDGRRYMNRHNVENSSYMVTKYETERLIAKFREENPGLDFPIDEVDWKFDVTKNEYTSKGSERPNDPNLIKKEFRTGESIYSKRSLFDTIPVTKVSQNAKILENHLNQKIKREVLDIAEPRNNEDLVAPVDVNKEKDGFAGQDRKVGGLFGLATYLK